MGLLEGGAVSSERGNPVLSESERDPYCYQQVMILRSRRCQVFRMPLISVFRDFAGTERAGQRFWLLQGYLAHKKTPPT